MNLYYRKFKGNFLSRLIKALLQRQGLLGLSTVIFLQPALAANIGSQLGTNIKVNDGDRVIADKNDAAGNRYGVTNPWGEAGIVDLGNNVIVSAIDPHHLTKGVNMQGSNSILKANNLTVEASGENAVGIHLSGNRISADLGSGTLVRAEGTSNVQTTGISIENASSLLADNLTIITKGNNGAGLYIADYGSNASLGPGSTIKTSGRANYGVYIDNLNGTSANGPARFTTSGLAIETQGSNAYGVDVQDDSVVNLGTDSQIKTHGNNAHGIWSYGNIRADALTITTEGKNANGIETRGGTSDIGAGSHVRSESGGGLVSTGPDTTINFSGTDDNRNTIFSKGSYGASAQSAGAKINLKNSDVTVDSDNSDRTMIGLWALGGGTITGENLTITGTKESRGIYAMTNSQVDLTGDLAINMADASQMAIATQNNEGYAASRINAKGKIDIIGSVFARGGIISLDAAFGSEWTGSAYSDNVNGGMLNVAMNNSVWNVAGDSSLDNLTLNGSTVDFTQGALSPANYSTLSIANLSGNGSFIMRTDLVGEGGGVNNIGDLIKVTQSSSGEHSLTIKNRGSLATTGHEVLTVVETADGVATFKATSKTELGGYLYDVRKNGNNWELYSSDKKPSNPAPSPTPSTTADAGGNYLNVGYMMNYAENQTLMQRMGDLRQSGERGNMWVRGYGGEFNAFSNGKLSGFDMGYSGLQIGADKRISVETPLFIGLFMGSTHASPDYRAGDGTSRSDYFGLYTSYMAQGGFYGDLVVKASRQKNSFNVMDSQNNNVHASGRANGVSASLETGQKFILDRPADGFYVEPQLQFTYGHQNAMGMNASNGLNIDLSSYKSMLGRASVLLGYENTAGISQLNVYLKTGGIREFSGDTAYRLNGSREKFSFKGNGWNNGLGISAQIGKQHTLYLEADITTGNVFNHRQIDGGYRYSF